MNEVQSSESVRFQNHRGLKEVVREILAELKDFAETRLQMAKSELQDTAASLKVAIPLSLLAVVLGMTAFLLLTGSLVVLIVHAFAGSTYAWFFGFLIVGVIWMMAAIVAAGIAYNEVRSRGRFPRRIVAVLKADRAWLQTEARNSL